LPSFHQIDLKKCHISTEWRCDTARELRFWTASFWAGFFGVRQLSVSTAPTLDPIALKFIAIGSSTFGMLVLLLDINTGCKSQRVQQIVVIKMTPLQQAKKSGSQMDTARELDKLAAVFLAGFYRVGGPSGSGAPALDP